MTGVIVRHKVRDYDTWLPAFIEHGEVRRSYGGIGDEVYRVNGDPNDLVLVLRFEDLARAQAFTADPSLPEAMQRGGVVSEPQITFTVSAYTADNTVAVG